MTPYFLVHVPHTPHCTPSFPPLKPPVASRSWGRRELEDPGRQPREEGRQGAALASASCGRAYAPTSHHRRPRPRLQEAPSVRAAISQQLRGWGAVWGGQVSGPPGMPVSSNSGSGAAAAQSPHQGQTAAWHTWEPPWVWHAGLCGRRWSRTAGSEAPKPTLRRQGRCLATALTQRPGQVTLPVTAAGLRGHGACS